MERKKGANFSFSPIWLSLHTCSELKILSFPPSLVSFFSFYTFPSSLHLSKNFTQINPHSLFHFLLWKNWKTLVKRIQIDFSLFPMKRQLVFSSLKPPFLPSEDYHRFDSRRSINSTADHDDEVIIVKSTVSFHFRSLSILFY